MVEYSKYLVTGTPIMFDMDNTHNKGKLQLLMGSDMKGIIIDSIGIGDMYYYKIELLSVK
jgi:hypothetical protein